MRRQLNLTIEADNEAFHERNARFEIARILRELSERLEATEESLYPNSAQWIRDINGNRVGTYKFEVR